HDKIAQNTAKNERCGTKGTRRGAREPDAGFPDVHASRGITGEVVHAAADRSVPFATRVRVRQLGAGAKPRRKRARACLPLESIGRSAVRSFSGSRRRSDSNYQSGGETAFTGVAGLGSGGRFGAAANLREGYWGYPIQQFFFRARVDDVRNHG